MALDVKIKTNTKQLSKNIKRYQKQLAKTINQGLLQAGFQLLDIIRTKTRKGVDYRDSPFFQYSEGYRKQLQREGKPTRVDLFNTGRMLGSLSPSSTVKKTGNNKVTLAFSNAEMRKRALFNQVLTDKKREFFGFNNQTERVISNSFNKFINKRMRRV